MFRFKQFAVVQEKSAMKVGTDAILLGSWSQFDVRSKRILDVGSGTGILSLMLVQRCAKPRIDAIEIESDAFQESVTNFNNSKWKDRLQVFHEDFRSFYKKHENGTLRYDGIISNPPFFNEAILPANEPRELARNSKDFSFDALVQGVGILLSNFGNFTTIIPFRREQELIELCKTKGLYLKNCCRVKGTLNAKIKRSLLCFSRELCEPLFDELVIETKRHQYTPEFVELTKDFYLNF